MGKKILILVFFSILHNIYGFDLQVTGRNISLLFSPEYNRTFDFCWDISAVGAVEINNRHVLKSGLAMGAAGNVFDIKCFVDGELTFFPRFPVNLNVAYKYNGLPEYENHTHSIQSLVSLKRQRWGISLGCNFRFSVFYDDLLLFEPIGSFLVYIFIINNDSLKLGLKAANVSEFASNNFGDYFLNLNNLIYISRMIALNNEIEIRQSGSVALAANFYGIVLRTGVLFSW